MSKDRDIVLELFLAGDKEGIERHFAALKASGKGAQRKAAMTDYINENFGSKPDPPKPNIDHLKTMCKEKGCNELFIYFMEDGERMCNELEGADVEELEALQTIVCNGSGRHKRDLQEMLAIAIDYSSRRQPAAKKPRKPVAAMGSLVDQCKTMLASKGRFARVLVQLRGDPVFRRAVFEDEPCMQFLRHAATETPDEDVDDPVWKTRLLTELAMATSETSQENTPS